MMTYGQLLDTLMYLTRDQLNNTALVYSPENSEFYELKALRIAEKDQCSELDEGTHYLLLDN